jgi:hypothetical protein
MQDELSIPDYSRINPKTIVVASKPTKDNKTQLQLLIVAGGLGLVGTVLLARILDGLLLTRRIALGKPDRATPGTPAGTPDTPLRRRQRRSGSAKPLESQPLPPNAGAEASPEPEATKVRASLP